MKANELTEYLRLEEQQTFRCVYKVFEALKLFYWLDQGTLLGLIREGRLLASDHDIDLGMWEKDYRLRRREIEAGLRKEGLFVEGGKPHLLSVIDLRGGGRMVNIAFYRRKGNYALKKMYCPEEGFFSRLLISLVLFCAHLEAGNLENKVKSRTLIFLAKVIPIGFFRLLTRTALRLRYFMRPSKQMAVPEKYFTHLDRVEAGDLKIPVPGEVEAYLALKYGDDWRTPKNDWDYFTDDGALVE